MSKESEKTSIDFISFAPGDPSECFFMKNKFGGQSNSEKEICLSVL
jgi:hypothetical protein